MHSYFVTPILYHIQQQLVYSTKCKNVFSFHPIAKNSETANPILYQLSFSSPRECVGLAIEVFEVTQKQYIAKIHVT